MGWGEARVLGSSRCGWQCLDALFAVVLSMTAVAAVTQVRTPTVLSLYRGSARYCRCLQVCLGSYKCLNVPASVPTRLVVRKDTHAIIIPQYLFLQRAPPHVNCTRHRPVPANEDAGHANKGQKSVIAARGRPRWRCIVDVWMDVQAPFFVWVQSSSETENLGRARRRNDGVKAQWRL